MITPAQFSTFCTETEKLAFRMPLPASVPLPVLLGLSGGLAGGLTTAVKLDDHRYHDQLLTDLGQMTPQVKAMRDGRRDKAIIAGVVGGTTLGAVSPYLTRLAYRQGLRVGENALRSMKDYITGPLKDSVLGGAKDVGRSAARGAADVVREEARDLGERFGKSFGSGLGTKAKDLGHEAAQGAVEGAVDSASENLRPGIWKNIFQ